MAKITEYHAKYFAHELTKRCSSDSLEKLSSTLSNAQVDLNPHQIEAALFAFKSPLSKGAILAADYAQKILLLVRGSALKAEPANIEKMKRKPNIEIAIRSISFFII